jgi:outer membrane protein TolC
MKALYKLLFFSLFAASGISSFAQDKWNLSMCIEQALKSNSDIKRQAVQVEKQNIQVQTDRHSRLPNLVAGGTQKFDFGRSLNRENMTQVLVNHGKAPGSQLLEVQTQVSNDELRAVQAYNTLRYAHEKYNAGKSTAYEFNETKMKLANSLSEQAQAKYEFMLQKYLLDFYSGNTKEQ